MSKKCIILLQFKRKSTTTVIFLSFLFEFNERNNSKIKNDLTNIIDLTQILLV